jgi:DNA-3-methyladenine glycosylase II
MKAIDHLTAVDPIFNSIIEKYGVPVIPERPQGLETLATDFRTASVY